MDISEDETTSGLGSTAMISTDDPASGSTLQPQYFTCKEPIPQAIARESSRTHRRIVKSLTRSRFDEMDNYKQLSTLGMVLSILNLPSFELSYKTGNKLEDQSLHQQTKDHMKRSNADQNQTQ